MRMHRGRAVVLALAAVVALRGGTAAAKSKDKIDGYLDFKKNGYLISDGQRIEVTEKTKINAGSIRNAQDIPLGYEIKAKGSRAKDGTFVAKTLEANKNGSEFMESEVISSSNAQEKKYVEQKEVADTDQNGKPQVVGKLITEGPDVDRCRRIIDRLLPPYIHRDQVRVYVVDNKAWNAMAMPNFSVYVFSGLLPDMSDDEMAIVLGHELTHAIYEHSRKEAKGGLIGSIAGVAGEIVANQTNSDAGKAAAQGATMLGVTTGSNVYSREFEDQADRVGLRYVYEAGYDVNKAPALWKRFADKYGDGNKVTNFFFGDHSLAEERAKNLQREIAYNYSDPRKDPPSNEAIARRQEGTGTGWTNSD
jgi:Zn-dependent protease with chaperone function